MQRFLQFRLASPGLPIGDGRFLGGNMVTGHIGYVFTVEGCPLHMHHMSCTWCVNVQHYSRFGNVMRLWFPHKLTL